MKEEIFAFLTGGILGVVFKYWFDYKGMVYKELWSKRFEVYKNLFQITAILPQYPMNPDVTYGSLVRASEQMRDWYFEVGGLLLSVKTRDKYFKVQKMIQEIAKGKEKNERLIDDYENVRQLFSQLRKQMTNDLMSRNRLSALSVN